VIDPEEGAVRLVIFGAMAALLLVSLCVPEAFGSLALAFALIYGVVRYAQIALFMLASPEDDALRHSVLGLGASTAVAVTLLATASLFDGLAQGALWALALFLDMAGPYFFGSEGWKLVPGHFAERHGLIIIIALGESIVAIGVGASHTLSLGIGTAAVLGVALTAAMWWIYFDVVAIVAGRRLSEAEVGKTQNEMARDSYSYLHLVMVAGIVLVALGLKTTIGHTDQHLHAVPAFALLGGLAIYLLGHVAFRYRHVHTINRQRLLLSIVLLILVPVATEVPALVTLGFANLVIWAMITYETRLYGDGRQKVRRPQTAEA
jgi:low temperature requirement protein LtrA